MYKVLYFSGDVLCCLSHYTTGNKDRVNLGALVIHRMVMRQWYAVPARFGHLRKHNCNRDGEV